MPTEGFFGGTNNSTAAFEYDSGSGKVTYNGVQVDSKNNPKDFPGSSSILIDVGLGIEYDASGNPKESTAFDIFLSMVRNTPAAGLIQTEIRLMSYNLPLMPQKL